MNLEEATILALQESEKKELKDLEDTIKSDEEDLKDDRMDYSDRKELEKEISDAKNRINFLNSKKELTEGTAITSFKVRNLIRDKLVTDKDKTKAEQLMNTYFDLRHIREREYLPNDIINLCEEGINSCYNNLAQLLGTDELY